MSLTFYTCSPLKALADAKVTHTEAETPSRKPCYGAEKLSRVLVTLKEITGRRKQEFRGSGVAGREGKCRAVRLAV